MLLATLVCALAREELVMVGNIGDSRAYHITEEGIRQISRDHSVVEDMVARGDITPEDEIILTADIIGGSPLTTALDVLTEKGLLGKTLAIGGMNLPLVLTAAFADADTPLDELEAELTGEAKDQIKRFALGGDEDDDI